MPWSANKMSPLQGLALQNRMFCYQNIASLRLGDNKVKGWSIAVSIISVVNYSLVVLFKNHPGSPGKPTKPKG